MGNLVSPNAMFEAAKIQMLDGREPSTHEEWALVANFFAANIHHNVARSAMRLMRILFDMPLTQQEIDEITEFQLRSYSAKLN